MRISKAWPGLADMAQKTKKFFLDVLFPVRCLGCGRENVWLCDGCLEKIPVLTEQVCPWCEKIPTPGGRVCFPCRKISPLGGLAIAASYRREITARLVHNFKYRFIEELAEPLGETLIRAYLDSGLPLPDLVVPVPLHPRRLRWRGFNQAGLLARRVARGLAPGYAIPLEEKILIREKFTRPQMKISGYATRKKNVLDAFRLEKNGGSSGKNPGGGVCGKTVLLVDDIATTGATLFECSKILKENGAREVFGLVVARQELKK